MPIPKPILENAIRAYILIGDYPNTELVLDTKLVCPMCWLSFSQSVYYNHTPCYAPS